MAVPSAENIALQSSRNKKPWNSGMPKLDRDGIKIHYEVHGSGPPLILTHGYSSTSEMWRGQSQAPSKKFKILFLGLRRHRQTALPHDPPTPLHTLADA